MSTSVGFLLWQGLWGLLVLVRLLSPGLFGCALGVFLPDED